MKKIILLFLILSFVLSSFVACGGTEEVSVFYYTYSDTYISGVRGEMNYILKEA